VAPHSRLQQRQRPVAHLPVFLHHAQHTNTVSNSRPPFHHSTIRNLHRPRKNVPAEQSHTRYPRDQVSVFTRATTRWGTRKTHVHSLRGFCRSALSRIGQQSGRCIHS
jgi:hypothetical protein